MECFAFADVTDDNASKAIGMPLHFSQEVKMMKLARKAENSSNSSEE